MLINVFVIKNYCILFFFFSSRRRHTRLVSDWSSDVCSSDLERHAPPVREARDGTGGVRPDARQRVEPVDARRQSAAVRPCGAMQIAGAAVVAEAAPRSQYVAEARARQRANGGEAREERATGRYEAG